MPIATGHRKVIAFGKICAAALLCIVGLDPSRAAGAEVFPPWTKLSVQITPDAYWGPNPTKGDPRLASDPEGDLFLSIADSLYVRHASGVSWETAPISIPKPYAYTSVRAGGNGTVLWGWWSSSDRGATWDSLPVLHAQGDNRVTAIAPSGYCLSSRGSYNELMRGDSVASQWTRVHWYWKSYSQIVDIVISHSQWAFAAPGGGENLQVSRDSGHTWRDLVGPQDSINAVSYQFLTGRLALETGYSGESLWMAGGGAFHDRRGMNGFTWSGDSLITHHPANSGFPDTFVTILKVQRLPDNRTALWLGTWGRGVYLSLDHGETWQACNPGLSDLHVEAMAIGAEGKVYALTREGLFESSWPASASIAVPFRMQGPGRAAWDGAGVLSIPLFGTPAGAFRADGRVYAPSRPNLKAAHAR